MMDLSVELDDEVVTKIREIAERHYGDSGDVSVCRVVESALKMRLLSVQLAQEGAADIEEPVVDWGFGDKQPAAQLPGVIQSWLFRKGGA